MPTSIVQIKSAESAAWNSPAAVAAAAAAAAVLMTMLMTMPAC
jgi:hypothetical protein